MLSGSIARLHHTLYLIILAWGILAHVGLRRKHRRVLSQPLDDVTPFGGPRFPKSPDRGLGWVRLSDVYVLRLAMVHIGCGVRLDRCTF